MRSCSVEFPPIQSLDCARGKPVTGLILTAALAGVVTVAAQTAQGTWTSKTPMSMARTEVGSAYVNGRIYVIGGGLGTADHSALVQEYDVKADRWRDRAPLPMEMSHAGVAALNGKVYVVGGFLRNVHLYAQPYGFEYDPARNTWRTLPWMKAARGSVSVVSLNGRIHAIGGRGIDRVTVGTHEIYDPATNRWSEAAPLPQPRDHAPAAVVDGRI